MSIHCFIQPAPTELYTLSLHDALPIFAPAREPRQLVEEIVMLDPPQKSHHLRMRADGVGDVQQREDRKSTRLNSSHMSISYAVFCLKKKKQDNKRVQVSIPITTYIAFI